jgi:integrase
MDKADLRYVTERVMKSGTTHAYWNRRGYDMVKLPGNKLHPKSVTLATQLNAQADNGVLPKKECQSQKQAGKGTINWLIDSYLSSDAYLSKAPRTQKDYLGILNGFRVQYGDAPIRDMEPPDGRQFIYALMQAMKDTPRRANYLKVVLSVLCKHGMMLGVLSSNPAEDIPQYRLTPRQQVWMLKDERQFLDKCADEMMQVALLLGTYTAQRQGDLLSLTWDQYDGQYITLKQHKTKVNVAIPVHSRLKPILDAMSRAGDTILTNYAGGPFKADYFRHRWRAATLAAGVDQLRFQDLRRTAIVRLGEAGSTVPEIAAISGHSMSSAHQILKTYLPTNITLADNAMAKWEGVGKSAPALELVASSEDLVDG